MGSMSIAEMQEIISCGHDKWGDRFAHVTVDTIEIPIPENILLYLRQDGLILPKEANYPEPSFQDTSFEYADYDGVDWSSAAEDTPELEVSLNFFCVLTALLLLNPYKIKDFIHWSFRDKNVYLKCVLKLQISI